MLNSSEGRWRKRLHIPTFKRDRQSAAPGQRLVEANRTVISDSSESSKYDVSSSVDNDTESNRNGNVCAPAALMSTPKHSMPGQSTPHFHALGPRASSSYESSDPIRLPIPKSGVHPGRWARVQSGEIVGTELVDESSRPLRDLVTGSAQSNLASSQRQPPVGQVAAIASAAIVSLVTYALYHASIEALVDETGAVWSAGVRSGAQQGAQGVVPLAMAPALGSDAPQTASNFVGGDRLLRDGLGPGVSIVTVSAWQSLCALGVGFVASRARKMSAWRKAETRTLSPGERTRRDRCLLAFAAAHLLGTALEYHTYGVVGPLGAEILRPTETAYFCLLSLGLGRHRRGLAHLPALLLVLGLALSAAPASGDLRVGGVGFLIGLASNVLLAIRALAAKIVLDDFGLDEISTLFSCSKLVAGLQVVILLAVEVPRAASGLPPYLLPHLWGVGVGVVEQVGAGIGANEDERADADEGWVTTAGEQRARLAFLLFINGVFLYGYVLALFALLSRVSATVFAILSGYVHAALVFVLLLSIDGSATGPRSVGMLLSTLAVSAHFYHASASNSGTSGWPDASHDGGEGERRKWRGAEGYNLPQLHVFLRESANRRSSVSRSRGRVDLEPTGGGESQSSPDHQAVKRPRGLFVPLLGTRRTGGMDEESGSNRGATGEDSALPDSAHSRGLSAHTSSRSLSSSWPSSSQSSDGNAEEGGAGDGPADSPSRFTWRWMGLRPAQDSSSTLRVVQNDGGTSGSQALHSESGDPGSIPPSDLSHRKDEGRQESKVNSSRSWAVSQGFLGSGQSGRSSDHSSSVRSDPALRFAARSAGVSAASRPSTDGTVDFSGSMSPRQSGMSSAISRGAMSRVATAPDGRTAASGAAAVTRAALGPVGSARASMSVTRLAPDDRAVVVAGTGNVAELERPIRKESSVSMLAPAAGRQRTTGTQRQAVSGDRDGAGPRLETGTTPREPFQVAHGLVAVELTDSAGSGDGSVGDDLRVGRTMRHTAGDSVSSSPSSLSLTSFEVIDKEDELWS